LPIVNTHPPISTMKPLPKPQNQASGQAVLPHLGTGGARNSGVNNGVRRRAQSIIWVIVPDDK